MLYRISATAVAVLAALLIVTTVAQARTGIGVVSGLVQILSEKPDRQLSNDNLSDISQYVDFDYIARYAIGPYEWNCLSSNKKKEYVALVKRLMEQRYYDRWQKLFADGKIVETTQSKAGMDILVNTLVVSGKRRTYARWRLHSLRGDLKIISLDVNGKDLLDHLKHRFNRVVSKGGGLKLIAGLRSQVQQSNQPPEAFLR
jgi:ABC-type transporter MlaC component